MSTTTRGTRPPAPTSAGSTPAVGPVPAAPPRLRRRPLMVVVSLLLVLVGAVVSGWAYSSLGNAREVVAVRVTVQRGQLITRDALQVVRVGVDPALAVVPAESIDQVVGKRAALDLAAGSLVTREGVTERVLPAAAQSVVGLSLSPGSMPGVPLQVGDRVRVVSTPGAQADVKPAELRVFDAAVVAVSSTDSSGKLTLSVAVVSGQAAELAARAASGRVAVVLDSRER